MLKSFARIDIKKVIVTGSLLLTLSVMLMSLYAPDSLVMTFANHSVADTILRVLIAGGFITVLATKPPRPAALRYAFGILSSVILVVACLSMIDYRIGMLDAAIYFMASIIMAMEAIEEAAQPVKFSSTDKLRARS